MELMSSASTAYTSATVRQPAAPPPKPSTRPMVMEGTRMLVNSENMNRMEPSCTRSLALRVMRADSAE